MGSKLVTGLRETISPAHEIVGLGTNHAAALAMKRAGATRVGVGAGTIAQTVQTADVIVGSLNVVLPGTMLGEITPVIARAILYARARKVLLPVNRAEVEIVGSEGRTLEGLIAQALQRLRLLLLVSQPS